MMFVEISGRQSGKTTRLVEHASNELSNNFMVSGYNIGIVTWNRPNGIKIRELIIEKFFRDLTGPNTGVRSYIHIRGRLMNMIELLPDMNGCMDSTIDKFYVDEFSYMSNLRVDPNAYYCSTPSANEFTKEIITFCRERGVEIETYDMSEGLRGSFGHEIFTEEFDSFCYENYIHPKRHPFTTLEYGGVNDNLILRRLKRHNFDG